LVEPVNPLRSGKARCVTAGYANKGAKHILESNYSDNPHKQTWDSVAEEVPIYADPIEWDEQGRPTKAVSGADGKVYMVYEVKDGLITIKDKQYPIKLPDGFYIIRKLTVSECKRLQTIPDWYEFPVSDTQAYKMIGNGWTIAVIKYLLSYIPNILNEEIEVLSMYDGMSCGQIALEEMGCNVVRYYATEIDPYAIKTTQHNFPNTIQLGDAFQVRAEGWHLCESD
jgi:site-specific DNA-cytosine methylase